MYELLKTWINFTTSGTQYNSGLSLSNQESALLYGSILISIMLIIFFADLIYRLIRSFIRR